MSWFASIGIAVLAGGMALLLAGGIANACVGWYRITSREGASGYFVVMIALLGGVAGAVLGLVVARVVASGSEPGFATGLLLATALIAALAGLAALACRLLADIPPRLGGRELQLEVELRLPSDEPRAPADFTGAAKLELASISGGRQRRAREGRLDLGAARLDEGRWVVPGAVDLFTRRGLRALDIELDGRRREGFLLPLPARPGPRHEIWSDWLPRCAQDGGPWPADRLAYRFRLRRAGPGPAEGREP
jgi:hypothetical protein